MFGLLSALVSAAAALKNRKAKKQFTAQARAIFISKCNAVAVEMSTGFEAIDPPA